MTPIELADEIGMSDKALRGWLRRTFPRPSSEASARWDLTPAQVVAARAHFGGAYRSPLVPWPAVAAPTQGTSQGPADWYWEGNVQRTLVGWLESQGFAIEFVANTATKERGDDIRARRGGRVLRIEVKGWPTKGRYADPTRAAETKRTQPSTQAGHWFGQALLHVLRDLGRHPGDMVGIGLPDWPRFRRLVAETEPSLRVLGIAVLFVSEVGTVEEQVPLSMAPRVVAPAPSR